MGWLGWSDYRIITARGGGVIAIFFYIVIISVTGGNNSKIKNKEEDEFQFEKSTKATTENRQFIGIGRGKENKRWS